MTILPLAMTSHYSMRTFRKKTLKFTLTLFFEFDDEYISSDVNPLSDEVLEDIESEDSYVSKLDEPDLLVTPLSDANEDERGERSKDQIGLIGSKGLGMKQGDAPQGLESSSASYK
ncbi:hypothetical protein Tco_0759690 [Tanacetum coccineum]